jgi:hypothetical protein
MTTRWDEYKTADVRHGYVKGLYDTDRAQREENIKNLSRNANPRAGRLTIAIYGTQEVFLVQITRV